MKKTLQRELKLNAESNDTATLEAKVEYKGSALSLSPARKKIIIISDLLFYNSLRFIWNIK